MACFPDTGDDERTYGRTGRDEQPDRRFGAGFLAGFLLAVLCVLVFLCGWFLAKRYTAYHSQSSEEAGASVLTDAATLSKLDAIQSLIEQDFLDEVDGAILEENLFQGIAAGLQDAYARYYSAEELQELNETTTGAYFGIGATVTMDEETGTLRVLEVYEDSPAMEGGLQSGDVLLALDGESLEGSDLQEAVSQIKAKEGTFTLKVYRESLDETLELSLACDEVALNYVQTEMMRGQTGYIRITEFTKRAAEQFEDAAAQLQEQGVQQLIVDLRGNPGGLLTSVCDILDTLSSEQLIVYTEDKAGKREEYYTAKEQLLDCPVAVLVDGDSASASEIFAGAIQDWGRGPIVGTQTYGKGIVQQTFALSDGSAIKFTVSRYYTPNGQDIHGNGITPDIIAAPGEEGDDAEDSVLETALDALLESNETEQQEN